MQKPSFNHLGKAMAPDELPNGNIGDWSELYTLAYLLVNGGAYGADENQDPLESLYYKVLQVIISSSESEPFLRYEIDQDNVIVYADNVEVKSILRTDIHRQMVDFFKELTNGEHSRHFTLVSGKKLLDILKKKTIKASSAETESDLELVIEDNQTKIQSPAVGFSIKSQLGSASTLLNASGATNLIYKVTSKSQQMGKAFPEFEHGKHRKNLQALYRAGFKLDFVGFQSETFSRNLQLLDSNMGDYIGKLLLSYYSTENIRFSDVVNANYPIDEPASRQPVFKIKEFLGAISMGMRPATEWDGDTTKFKGIILVKNDGDVVFYYLYNRKSFEEYLYNNVRFDRPDTSRHQYGAIYEENGEHFLKLNLQVRFVR
jgi:hypothetical protein